MNDYQEAIHKAIEAGKDVARLEAIEDCAKIADENNGGTDGEWDAAAEYIASEIRKLAN